MNFKRMLQGFSVFADFEKFFRNSGFFFNKGTVLVFLGSIRKGETIMRQKKRNIPIHFFLIRVSVRPKSKVMAVVYPLTIRRLISENDYSLIYRNNGWL